MKRLRLALTLLLAVLLSACASLLPGDAPQVDVVGVQPVPGQGMELRLLVKLRVMNPNDTSNRLRRPLRRTSTWPASALPAA